MRKAVETLDELFARCAPEPNTGCWLWTESAFVTATRQVSYGQIYVKGHGQTTAHRRAWELAKGPIPDGMCVLHRCDTMPCCNPDHLFLGTQLDNIRDMVAKGRSTSGKPREKTRGDNNPMRRHPDKVLRGERNGKARFTEEQVRWMREQYAAGAMTQVALAAKFGVAQAVISHIILRKSWRHVA